MTGVIDVFALMEEKRLSLQKRIIIDYTKSSDTFTVARFIFECGMKLEAKPLTISTAACFFHRFMREPSAKGYDPYLIASSCLFLAGKLQSDKLILSDIMNVSYNTLHRHSKALEPGEQYWNMENAIKQTEVLIMRFNFPICPELSYKFILHYLRALQVWIGNDEWSKYPIAGTSMALLQDFHHSAEVLDYPASWIAIACINLSLQIYGVVVPLFDECDKFPWFNIFSKDLTKDRLFQVMEIIMAIYDHEPEVKENER